MKVKKTIIDGKSFSLIADYIDEKKLKEIAPPISLMGLVEKNYVYIHESTGVKPDILILGKQILEDLKDDKDFQEAIDQTNFTSRQQFKYFCQRLREREDWNGKPYPPSIEDIIKRGKLKYLGKFTIAKKRILHIFSIWDKSDNVPDMRIILCNSKLQNFF